MTKAGIIYGLSWRTVENNVMMVQIYDNSVQIDAAADETVYLMQPSGATPPLRISVTNNEENKYSSIRAKKATICFLNDDSFNYQTFATGEDERFYVEASCDGTNIFRGWLEQGDIHEPFLSQNNQEVILTAVDGLAQLKGIPLVDYDGNNPTGKIQILEFIFMSLFRTGLDLTLNIINNLREQDSAIAWKSTAQFTAPHTMSVPFGYVKYFRVGNLINIAGSASNNGNKTVATITDLGLLGGIITFGDTIVNEAGGPEITFTDIFDGANIYQRCYLDAKTFEDQIGTCVDCYTVLERILGHDCFVEQRLGEWWVMRVKEMRHDFAEYMVTYTSSGLTKTISFSTNNFGKAIGLKDVTGTPFPASPDAISYFSQAATSRTILRPDKSVKLFYKFILPLEVPCNKDFNRGDFIANLPDEIVDGLTLQAKKYQIDCWTYEKNVPPVTQDSVAYIKKLFENDYEKERFVHMEQTAANSFYYLRCNDKIPFHARDKFKIGCSIRYGSDLGGGSGHFTVRQIWIRLYGEDGTYWNVHAVSGTGSSDPNAYWQQSDSTWGTNQKFLEFEGESSATDFTQWQSVSFDIPALPVNGDIEVLLLNTQTPSSQTKDFSSLSFDYIPLIGGSYNYKNQYNKTTRDGVYKAKIEDEIFITNSPKKLFKGALWKKHPVTSVFMLAGLFYEGQEFYYGNDGVNNLKSYGELQVRAVHNQFRNGDETVQLTAQGFNGVGCIDLIDRIYNRDLEPATNNRAFQLVWMDQDWKRCEWTGTMIKNFDLGIGFVQDNFEFKYESE